MKFAYFRWNLTIIGWNFAIFGWNMAIFREIWLFLAWNLDILVLNLAIFAWNLGVFAWSKAILAWNLAAFHEISLFLWLKFDSFLAKFQLFGVFFLKVFYLSIKWLHLLKKNIPWLFRLDIRNLSIFKFACKKKAEKHWVKSLLLLRLCCLEVAHLANYSRFHFVGHGFASVS